jgi:hypothetical protein
LTLLYVECATTRCKQDDAEHNGKPDRISLADRERLYYSLWLIACKLAEAHLAYYCDGLFILGSQPKIVGDLKLVVPWFQLEQSAIPDVVHIKHADRDRSHRFTLPDEIEEQLPSWGVLSKWDVDYSAIGQTANSCLINIKNISARSRQLCEGVP